MTTDDVLREFTRPTRAIPDRTRPTVNADGTYNVLDVRAMADAFAILPQLSRIP